MKKALILATAAVLVAGAPAFAHPHIFAEARLEIVSDDAGNQVQELRNVWRFDDMFSASVVMDFDKNSNGKLDPDELTEVGKTVKESLGEYDYYTTITDNGKTIKVTPPDIIHVDYKDGQLLMFFVVKPSEPMPLKGRLTLASTIPPCTRRWILRPTTTCIWSATRSSPAPTRWCARIRTRCWPRTRPP